MNNKELLPSLLAFDKENWINDFQIFKNNKINFVHYDVMDKEYVGNTAFNENDYQIFLKNNDGLKAHVHLMVLNPQEQINNYLYPQTDSICFHFDVVDKNTCIESLQKIRKHNIKAGIAISPNFKINDFEDLLDYCDLVTVMGVFPGKGGQKFIETSIDTIKAIVNYNIEHQKNIKIELDGGMNFDTIPLVYSLIDYVVAGSFLEKNKNNLAIIVEWFSNI